MWTQSAHPWRFSKTALCAVGLLLPFAVSCQWTSADQVDRTPNLARGSGGSSGHDVGLLGDAGSDGPADGPTRYNDSAIVEAAATDRYEVGRDVAVIDSRATMDGGASTIDLGQGTDEGLTCVDGESAFCDESSDKTPTDGD